jgi:molybdate transport system substrate-binding protein
MRRLATILVTLVIAATFDFSPASARAEKSVLVFAAASTRDAMEEVIEAFRGGQVKGVYASTAALSRQILDGAPASIFLSASKAWADVLQKAGVLAKRTDFLRNRLVLVAPKAIGAENPINVPGDIPKVLAGGRLAMAETRSVPAGIYGRQALTNLGLWDDLEMSVAGSPNVRVALLLVERDETPLGIVYATDARASEKVATVWSFPATTHEPIIYPLALINSSQTSTVAIAFLEFLSSPRGREIFRHHGFETD